MPGTGPLEASLHEPAAAKALLTRPFVQPCACEAQACPSTDRSGRLARGLRPKVLRIFSLQLGISRGLEKFSEWRTSHVSSRDKHVQNNRV